MPNPETEIALLIVALDQTARSLDIDQASMELAVQSLEFEPIELDLVSPELDLER